MERGSGLFGRVVAALLDTAVEEADGSLVAYHPGLAVLELGPGRPTMVIDAVGARRGDLENQLGESTRTYQVGALLIVLVGGDASLIPTMMAARRAAPEPDKLSVYHVDADERLTCVVGRRSPILERATGRLHSVAPLSTADVPALIERGQRERDEAARLVSRLRGHFQPVTLSIGCTCLIMYMLAALLAMRPSVALLLHMGANASDLVRRGEWWRLLASSFLHGGAAHFFINMMALGAIGSLMETVLGWRRYIILYCASALGAGLASAFVMRASVSVGASGALWGLMVAALVVARSRKGMLPRRLAKPLARRLPLVVVLNLVASFLPGVDYAAHIGGGLVGLTLTGSGAVLPRGHDGDGESTSLRILAVAAAAALAGSVAMALVVGRPWTSLQ